jgi:alkyl hydroperoxide reductase subunit AhpC
MNIEVLVESISSGVRVSTGWPWNLTAEAPTEPQAVRELQDQYQQKLLTGARVVRLSFEDQRVQKAWDTLASIPDDEWAQFQDAIQDNRKSADNLDAVVEACSEKPIE